MKTQWQPSADISTLKTRAEFLAKIRQFFHDQNVLEVDTPVLASFTVTDPNIESIAATCNEKTAYLQTSPEFFMKRLLAAGSGDIYYLGKSFRDEEFGAKHNPEFTMLEWYRVGYNDHQLIENTLELIFSLLPEAPVTKLSYKSLFEKHFNVNPHTVSVNKIKMIAQQYCDVQFDSDDVDVWLNLLFTHVIEPAMQGWFVVYDFPESQGALAKKAINEDGDVIAKRFEIYCDGLELGNGYWELTDAKEQRQRFENDVRQRKLHGYRDIHYDENILAALDSGMPECAGIAMGVDRLLMIKTKKLIINDVISFVFE